MTITDVTSDGISGRNRGSLTIDNVTITSTGGDGINCYDSILNNVMVTEAGITGIGCGASSFNNVMVTSTGTIGIGCGRDSTLNNVMVTEAGSIGIISSRGTSLNNVTITRSKEHGIYFSDSGSLKIRTSIITQNSMDGVYGAGHTIDLGTAEDPGHNQIYRNRGYNVNGPASAIGNWWGQDPPNERLFNGEVQYDPWLTEPPVPAPQPSIKTVSPDQGAASGGTLIKITGSRFLAGATVTINGVSATGVSVDSETQITAVTPAGTAGPTVVIVSNPDGNTSNKAAFTYVEDVDIKETIARSSGIYQMDLTLTKGVNIFSLPLRPEAPITASQIASDLGATVVLRAFEGRFQAYLPDVGFGPDFTLEVGKGVIVNLLEARTYSVTGRPWGTEVPAAPASPTETWAFVVAGRIDGVIPVVTYRVRVTNLHTGETLIIPLSSSGEFTAAFVDMSKQRVVAVGDVITTQLIGAGDVPMTQAKRHIISREQIAHAYLLTSFSATPNKTRLLQNYPNPFNPETWISFQLAQSTSVAVEIYDLNGHLVRRLELGHREAGWHISRDRAVYWDGRNSAGEKMSSGVYFYRLRAGDFSAQRKLVVAK